VEKTTSDLQAGANPAPRGGETTEGKVRRGDGKLVRNSLLLVRKEEIEDRRGWPVFEFH